MPSIMLEGTNASATQRRRSQRRAETFNSARTGADGATTGAAVDGPPRRLRSTATPQAATSASSTKYPADQSSACCFKVKYGSTISG